MLQVHAILSFQSAPELRGPSVTPAPLFVRFNQPSSLHLWRLRPIIIDDVVIDQERLQRGVNVAKYSRRQFNYSVVVAAAAVVNGNTT